MRIFFEKWAVFLNRSPPANDLDDKERNGVQTPIVKSDQVDYAELLLANRLPLANDLEFEEFFSIGFTLHYEIIAKTNNLEERLFYIHQANINRWDKYKLREMLKSDLFHHQGKLPNNFTNTMQNTRDALQAIGMFKDEYLLDFINVEELGVRDEADIDERVVEKAIINNVKNFIMTFFERKKTPCRSRVFQTFVCKDY